MPCPPSPCPPMPAQARPYQQTRPGSVCPAPTAPAPTCQPRHDHTSKHVLEACALPPQPLHDLKGQLVLLRTAPAAADEGRTKALAQVLEEKPGLVPGVGGPGASGGVGVLRCLNQVWYLERKGLRVCMKAYSGGLLPGVRGGGGASGCIPPTHMPPTPPHTPHPPQE